MAERKGKAICLTLEHEAASLLRRQCPGGKSLGKHVSDLVYAEEYRRHELRQLREKVDETVAEVLTAP